VTRDVAPFVYGGPDQGYDVVYIKATGEVDIGLPPHNQVPIDQAITRVKHLLHLLKEIKTEHANSNTS